jgi:hypothetical protein
MADASRGIWLAFEEASALERYIAAHGIPYNGDDGLIQGIESKLKLLNARGDAFDPRQEA